MRNPSQSYRASLAIWNHTVLPATRHKWMRPVVSPASQAGTRFTYPGRIVGRVDLDSSIAARLGIEPTTAWMQVRRPNRYATEPPNEPVANNFVKQMHTVAFSAEQNDEISGGTCLGTDCRTTPRQLTEVIEPCSTPWLSQFGLVVSQWTEHYVVNTDEPFGELVAVIISVRHKLATQHWYLQSVVVVSDPNGPGRIARCFPCHDVVPARVTLRTGNGNSCTCCHFYSASA